MKNTKGIVYKRQQSILQQLKDHHSVRVDDLARILSVSPITIRRDLQMFEEQGMVARFHGGASIIEGTVREDPAMTETGEESHKEAIARYAASLVENGDTIFLNSSSTSLLMLRYLTGRRAIVVTNNGKALTIERDPLVELVLTGGEVYRRKQSMVGEIASQTLSRIVADKTFLGVSGISAMQGVTTSVLQETAVNELMMKRCGGNCFVLADHTKIGKQNNFFSGPIRLVRTLITDWEADPEELGRLRSCGVEILQTGETP